MSWRHGADLELARALALLSDDQRQLLGQQAALDPGAPYPWLADLPAHAPAKLLIIIDQFDDFVTAHREQLGAGNITITADELAIRHDGWRQLGALVRDRRAHVLLVSRSDAHSRLEPFRFVEPRGLNLPRVRQNLLRPLFARIVEPDANGLPVVEYPAAGWDQLTARFLRDLGPAGDILPIQLAVTLDALSELPYLTISEYERYGGLPGLERRQIERQVREAIRSEPISSERALISALFHLASAGAGETARSSVVEFAADLGSPDLSEQPGLGRLLDILEAKRIVKRHAAPDGKFVALYHAYLARGVRAAFRQANKWAELLRERHKSFAEVEGLRQKWKALLSRTDLLRILWRRLLGDLAFGQYRSFVALSSTRFLPVAALALMVLGAVLLWRVTQTAQQGRDLLSRISGDGGSGDARAWQEFASMPMDSRLRGLLYAARTDSMTTRLFVKTPDDRHDRPAAAAVFFHVAAGLDVDGSFSRRLSAALAQGMTGGDHSAENAMLAGEALAPYLRCTGGGCDPLARVFADHLKAFNVRRNAHDALTQRIATRLPRALAAIASPQSHDQADTVARLLLNQAAERPGDTLRSWDAGDLVSVARWLPAYERGSFAERLLARAEHASPEERGILIATAAGLGIPAAQRERAAHLLELPLNPIPWSTLGDLLTGTESDVRILAQLRDDELAQSLGTPPAEICVEIGRQLAAAGAEHELQEFLEGLLQKGRGSQDGSCLKATIAAAFTEATATRALSRFADGLVAAIARNGHADGNGDRDGDDNMNRLQALGYLWPALSVDTRESALALVSPRLLEPGWEILLMPLGPGPRAELARRDPMPFRRAAPAALRALTQLPGEAQGRNHPDTRRADANSLPTGPEFIRFLVFAMASSTAPYGTKDERRTFAAWIFDSARHSAWFIDIGSVLPSGTCGLDHFPEMFEARYLRELLQLRGGRLAITDCRDRLPQGPAAEILGEIESRLAGGNAPNAEGDIANWLVIEPIAKRGSNSTSRAMSHLRMLQHPLAGHALPDIVRALGEIINVDFTGEPEVFLDWYERESFKVLGQHPKSGRPWDADSWARADRP